MMRRVLYAAAVLALAACAGNEVERPTDQLSDATRAMESARQANAYEFASFEMTSADRKLARARTLTNSDEDEERLEARRLAEQVTLDARLAEAKARLAQSEATKSEMSRTVDALRDQVGSDAGGAS